MIFRNVLPHIKMALQKIIDYQMLFQNFRTFDRNDEETTEDIKLISNQVGNFDTQDQKHVIEVVELDEKTLKIAEIAQKYILRSGLTVQNPDLKNCIIEKHSYFSEQKYSGNYGLFCSHIDNDGPLVDPVVSCFIYLENTFKFGGELLIERDITHSMHAFQTHLVVDPRRFSFVVLDGKISHSIADCCGKGLRTSIVVQIKK